MCVSLCCLGSNNRWWIRKRWDVIKKRVGGECGLAFGSLLFLVESHSLPCPKRQPNTNKKNNRLCVRFRNKTKQKKKEPKTPPHPPIESSACFLVARLRRGPCMSTFFFSDVLRAIWRRQPTQQARHGHGFDRRCVVAQFNPPLNQPNHRGFSSQGIVAACLYVVHNERACVSWFSFFHRRALLKSSFAL